MPSDSWLNELECLINEVHRKKEVLNLFGSFVKERKFETTARERDWTVQCYNTGDAAAIFDRYITLIERLMALRSPGNVINVRVIYEKVSKYLGESYQIAISRKSTDQENGDWCDQRSCTIKQVTLRFISSGKVSDGDVSEIISCVIVTWAQSVPVIKLRVKRDRTSSEDATYMEDLPSILALS